MTQQILPRVRALSLLQSGLLKALHSGGTLVRTYGHGDTHPTYTLNDKELTFGRQVTDLWHDCYLVTHGEAGAGPLQLHLTDKGRAAIGVLLEEQP